MLTDLPKVLIIGQPFNKVSGGGITLSNLFKFWPKENLFLATNTHRALKNDYSLCPNVYLLGKEEVRIPFLLRPLLKNAESGPVTLLNSRKKYDLAGNPSIISKSNFFYKALTKLLQLFDLNYLLFRIRISKKFEKWVEEIKPDIIYSQLGHLEFNYFILELKSRFHYPLVIHIMDDWPEKSASGLFKNYWQNKMRNSFLQILKVTDELITISDSMRQEYYKRYNKGRFHFHNPIQIQTRDQFIPATFSKGEELKIGYFGRIGKSNINSISKTIEAVSELNKSGFKIIFDIYTPDIFALKDKANRSIQILGPIPHDQMLTYMSNYQLLLLPLDFDDDSQKYARYSFPTKASEYMVSGRLILVFGPAGTAVVDHAKQRNWSAVVEKDSKDELKEEIISIFNGYSSYSEKITNAIKIARDEFDERFVCKNFADLFIEINQRNKHPQLDKI